MKEAEHHNSTQLPFSHWFIRSKQNEHLELWLVEKVKIGKKVCIISDRSYSPLVKVRVAVWVIRVWNDQENYIFSTNVTPREKEIQYSHQSELGRLVGALFY